MASLRRITINEFGLLVFVFILLLSQIQLSYFRHDDASTLSVYNPSPILKINTLSKVSNDFMNFSNHDNDHVIGSHLSMIQPENKVMESNVDRLRNTLECKSKSKMERKKSDDLRDSVCIEPDVLHKAMDGTQPWLCRAYLQYILERKRGGSYPTPTNVILESMEDEAKTVSELCSGHPSQNFMKSYSHFFSKKKLITGHRNESNVVLVALHDGLGNQMFQVAFGILFADDFYDQLTTAQKSQSLKMKGPSKSSFLNNQQFESSTVPVVLLDDPSMMNRDVFLESSLQLNRENHLKRPLHRNDDKTEIRTNRRQLKNNVRSDGATALLQALYPNMRKRVLLSSSILHNTIFKIDQTNKTNYQDLREKTQEKDARLCVEALSQVSLGVFNGTIGDYKIKFQTLTDIDRLWRIRGDTGFNGFIKQFQSFWDEKPENIKEEDKEDQEDKEELSIIRCIVTDGFFQKPFLYELDKSKLKHLFHLNFYHFQNHLSNLSNKKNNDNNLKFIKLNHRYVVYNLLTNLSNQDKEKLISFDDLLPISGLKDVVIHLRTCEHNRRGGNMNLSKSFYPPLPLSYLSSSVLLANQSSDVNNIVWVVGPSSCLKSPFLGSIQSELPNHLVRPFQTKYHEKSYFASSSGNLRSSPKRQDLKLNKKFKEEQSSVNNNEQAAWQQWAPSFALIADIIFLNSASNRIILSVGSFSFWCGWLGNATEVHVPIAGRQQQYILFGERDRFVYHDLRNSQQGT